MARLNISLPDDLYALAAKWRRNVNLSEICANALRRELEALEINRTAGELFSVLKPPTKLEKALVSRFGISEAVVPDFASDPSEIRDLLGEAGADYLSRYLCDESLLAIGGGRQMWCLVRNLKPRQLSVTVTGLGIGQNDPRVLHAHANTLTTLLWLLFSPRAQARAVGRNGLELGSIWKPELPLVNYPKYFVVGSCGPFDAACPLASLLGQTITDQLLGKGACGDFLYHFFDESGAIVSAPPIDCQSILPLDLLRTLAGRPDSKVILVGGGPEKIRTIRFTLGAGLCNVLITDVETAQRLLSEESGVAWK